MSRRCRKCQCHRVRISNIAMLVCRDIYTHQTKFQNRCRVTSRLRTTPCLTTSQNCRIEDPKLHLRTLRHATPRMIRPARAMGNTRDIERGHLLCTLDYKTRLKIRHAHSAAILQQYQERDMNPSTLHVIRADTTHDDFPSVQIVRKTYCVLYPCLRVAHLEAVGPAASTSLLKFAPLRTHVRLDSIVSVKIVYTKDKRIIRHGHQI